MAHDVPNYGLSCCRPIGSTLQHHAQGLRNFHAAVDKFGPDLATWPSDKNPAVAAARLEVLTCLVHVADVCNVMKPRAQAAASAGRFMQGKKQVNGCGHRLTGRNLPSAGHGIMQQCC
jgi:hypothetical protein